MNTYATDPQTSSPAAPRKPLNLHRLQQMHAAGEKLAMLTAYDATFARLLDECGVDCLLVGDSLGMVVQGQSSTIPVTLDEMIYHTQCVARGNQTAWVVGDMPFGSYQQSKEQTLANATRLMQAGAHMIKLEGGGWTTETTRFLTERGIPVCAHLGLTPQSVHALGGYRIQGRDEASAQTLRAHAKALHEAGATMMVLELMPSAVAAQVQEDNPQLMVIGIGAGARVAGQVLVSYDMLRLTRGKLPRFARNFMADSHATSTGAQDNAIESAVRRFVAAVKDGTFPDETLHGY